MSANLLTLSSAKTEFLLIGLKQQVVKIHNSSLNTTHLAGNFASHLGCSDHISVLCKSCYSHVRELRCIRLYVDSKTACRSIIATSTVLSKLDCCNSLYYNLPKSQIHRLHQIQILLVRLSKPLHSLTSLLSQISSLAQNQRTY